MRASRRFHAKCLIIFYPFHRENQTDIAWPNLMITRSQVEIISLYRHRSACTYRHEHQVIPFPGRGDSDCGTIRLDCRLGLGEIRSDCQRCRTRFGSLAHRKRVIYRFRTILALSGAKRRRRADRKPNHPFRIRTQPVIALRLLHHRAAAPLPLRGPRGAEHIMDSSHNRFVRRSSVHP